MSIMDLLKSPKGIDLLEDLYDAVDGMEHPKGDPELLRAFMCCQYEIATQQAIDRFKEIDGTPAEIKHKWIP